MGFKNSARKFDYLLFFSTMLIIALGILFIFSAVYHGKITSPLWSKQLIAVGLGLVLMFLAIVVNYQIFGQYGYYFYFFSLISLVLVLFLGKTVRGAQSWFVFSNFSIQPSEFAKIPFIFALSIYLSKNNRQIESLKTLIVPLLLTLIPMILILKQPDFGSAMMLLPVCLVMMFVGGAKSIYLLSFFLYVAITLGIPFLITYLSFHQDILINSVILKFITMAVTHWFQGIVFILVIVLVLAVIFYLLINFKFSVNFNNFIITSLLVVGGCISSCFVQNFFLRGYQKKRLLAFLDPQIDPLGAGYHIIQSKIAIGSGGFFGKGFLNGTQTQLGFLPEQHTDFILSVMAEEWGFFGAVLVIFLFFIIIWRGLKISMEARDMFGSFLAVGISCVFLFYTITNVGMVMGIMPITGLPLPLFSYGGSALVSGMIAIGLLLNIHLRRYTY
ncbi:rod shape-determining protein RodA [bacterium]|nr:rod shape-determining protein RodA [bacterium]